MIFLPNKYERYCAALRNYLQKSYLKSEKSKSINKSFKKIYEFEAVYLEREKLPCDLKLLSSKMLISAYSKLLEKNINLDFKIEIKDNFIINIKLYSIVLLKLAYHSKSIVIKSDKGKIFINCKTNIKINEKLLNALNAVSFYEKKSNTYLIVINAEATNKKSIEMNGEWDISNPFSPVNIFLT